MRLDLHSTQTVRSRTAGIAEACGALSYDACEADGFGVGPVAGKNFGATGHNKGDAL